jgi:hypothetical protein
VLLAETLSVLLTCLLFPNSALPSHPSGLGSITSSRGLPELLGPLFGRWHLHIQPCAFSKLLLHVPTVTTSTSVDFFQTAFLRQSLRTLRQHSQNFTVTMT